MAVGQKCVLGFITRGVAPGYGEYGLRPKFVMMRIKHVVENEACRQKQTRRQKQSALANANHGQRPYSMHHAPGGLNMAVGQKCVLGFITRGVAPGYDEYGLRPKFVMMRIKHVVANEACRQEQTRRQKQSALANANHGQRPFAS
jgi:hypothetical protein